MQGHHMVYYIRAVAWSDSLYP